MRKVSLSNANCKNKKMTSLEAGQVLEKQATDKGSTADLN
jgi:hypothetical protein